VTVVRELSPALARVVGTALGVDATIENLRELTGGASRSTWAFDAVTPDERRSLILRIGPPDDVHAGMELEARAQAAAAAAGAPVPHVLVADNSPAAFGNPFLICEEVKGETIVRRIDRMLDKADGAKSRERLLRQCAQALAAIHRADVHDAELTTQDQLAEWRGRLDVMGDTTATFEWAFRWLAAHRPVRSPVHLVHGDYRMGNLIVDGSELAAVLDWELVHIGEVYEDLAWFCIRAWRFGAPASRAAGGLGSTESFLHAYEQAGGAPVERAAFRWWLVLATLRWGVICRYQAERHLSGQHRSVELAAIGRRVPETEWDLLTLLDGAAPPGDDASHPAARGGGTPNRVAARGRAGKFDPPGDKPGRIGDTTHVRRAGRYGRPTAAELVAAVSEFLETDVRQSTTGQVNFHARVAANALRIVERELLVESSDDVTNALASVGFNDEPRLAAAIRAGQLDGRGEQVRSCLRVVVGHRLSVAHPSYRNE
jgi:aminoglycoside phosphotransferase (APT) family kinase protein